MRAPDGGQIVFALAINVQAMEWCEQIGHTVCFLLGQACAGAEAAVFGCENVKQIMVFPVGMAFQNVGFGLRKLLALHGAIKRAMLCFMEIF